METQAFPTKPLLRPAEAESRKDEIKKLEEKLSSKHIEDKGEVNRQLRMAKKDFDTQIARPPETRDEEDRMVKRSRDLLSKILPGMPSQEEMRKAPPGAVDKHMAWERRNKKAILEWKHLQLRLTAGSGNREVANLEKHRPTVSTLSMDNAQIPGKAIYLPENPDGLGVTFSEAQLALLEQLAPDLRQRLASLTNSERSSVKSAMEGIGLAVEPKKRKAKPERKPWTQEQKDALKARLAAGRAKKAQQAQQG